jgi:hypothetical protein
MSEGRRSEPEKYRAEELAERVTGLHDEMSRPLPQGRPPGGPMKILGQEA